MGIASLASAKSFTAEGGLLDPTHGYSTIADRSLINDGSFEGGTCQVTPIWNCSSGNICDSITDLVPLGLWNYDGMHVAWLGGFCGAIPIEFLSICQAVDFGGGCGLLTWFWMVYANAGGGKFFLTVDGNVLFEHVIALDDHLLDYQWAAVDVSTYYGMHELCLEYDRNGAAGDNYFADYLEMPYANPTAADAFSFSVVKSLY